MPCDHIGGPELIEMAEEFLRKENVAPAQWPGRRFRWAENPTEGMWASIVIEVERRGEAWVVTKIDRAHEPVAETGFKSLS